MPVTGVHSCSWSRRCPKSPTSTHFHSAVLCGSPTSSRRLSCAARCTWFRKQKVPLVTQQQLDTCLSVTPCSLSSASSAKKVCFAFWHVYVLWLGVYWWKRDVRATHDVTSERYTTWRQICPTKDKISVHGSFMRMRILPGAYRNTITRIRFHASGYFSSSAIPLCASGHVSFATW